MKLLFAALTILLGYSALGQNQNPSYNDSLATKLGADAYGMKRYVLVMLKTGTNKTTNKTFIDSCFRGHMENINRMAEAGKLVVAGPIGKNENSYRGIFILNTNSLDEANELLQSDAAIMEHLLEPELYSWYGSAALPLYLEASDMIWKLKP